MPPSTLLPGCGKQAPAPARQPPEVTVITITPRTIPFSPQFVAQTESSRQVNIVARVSGFLEKIAYQEGELVKQGQLMFTLDPKPFQAQLQAAQGELQSQQARLVTAQATYGRVKPLAEQDALPLTDLDRAKGELDSAKAAVFSAQGQGRRSQAQPRLRHDHVARHRPREPRAAAAGRVRQLARPTAPT